MILSFHPCVPADRNALCAGRPPGAKEMALLRAAGAVILPQGCREDLYRAAKESCPRVFPDYDARFRFPGKTGQIALFSETRVLHPKSVGFPSLQAFRSWSENVRRDSIFDFPFVFKFDWGGEGQTVHPIASEGDLRKVLDLARSYEATGQYGFLLQEYVPGGNRTLRVVVIASRIVSYWKIQRDPTRFASALSQGAVIDGHSHGEMQKAAVSAAGNFCRMTGINLAGIDFLFSGAGATGEAKPQFLEINYFFGRKGLGGSENYYRLLRQEVKTWLRRTQGRRSEVK